MLQQIIAGTITSASPASAMRERPTFVALDAGWVFVEFIFAAHCGKINVVCSMLAPRVILQDWANEFAKDERMFWW
jgi:hypothetical protein